MFKKAALVLLLGMVFSVAASAQSADVYWVNYFINNTTSTANPLSTTANDEFVFIINPGVQGAPINPSTGAVSSAGNLCANIYVFDASQEMQECCSCALTPNALTTLSVKYNLTSNPITGVIPATGVIKIVSSAAAGGCNAGTISAANIIPNLRAWGTHQQTVAGATATATTETDFQASSLSPAEEAYLPVACEFASYLGSGRGICSCSTPS
jgi:hypothetical protein